MTQIDDGNVSGDTADEEFIALIANLQLSLDVAAEGIQPDPPPPPPPRTPSPPPPPPISALARHTFPEIRSRSYTLNDRPTIYHYQNETTEGLTDRWSLAAAATQGVPHGQVHTVQVGSPRKPRTTKAAYVIYCGTSTGVRRTWKEAQPLVTRVRNCIFRGYATLAEANNAWNYAVGRGWVRLANAPMITGISNLPRPTSILDGVNPLSGAEGFDGTCLECQLNTLGIRGAVHESVVGLANALAKFEAAGGRTSAGGRTEVDAANPPPYSQSPDVFT
ncbi:hypothetical protein C8R43DRAFT_1140772 [Mycena crocata]|nr:hypothetical protein C8R43DRAFT_1140772 [Mycena crocata]